MFKAESTGFEQIGPKALWVKGEKLAGKYLKRNGYKILKRNYVSKSGEIDIIAYNRGTIAFVEVKARKSDLFGPPELAITNEKRRRIMQTALNYLVKNNIEDIDYRFDVVSISYKKGLDDPDIEFLKDAFTADGILRT